MHERVHMERSFLNVFLKIHFAQHLSLTVDIMVFWEPLLLVVRVTRGGFHARMWSPYVLSLTALLYAPVLTYPQLVTLF